MIQFIRFIENEAIIGPYFQLCTVQETTFGCTHNTYLLLSQNFGCASTVTAWLINLAILGNNLQHNFKNNGSKKKNLLIQTVFGKQIKL